MSDFNENVGVEEQEVTAPADNGAEEQEVAAPDIEEEVIATGEETGRTSADSAFAEMRRAKEAAEREAAQLRAEAQARKAALERITGEKNGEFRAIAETFGASIDDVAATIDAERELALKNLEVDSLREQISSIEAEKSMQEDLAQLQKIDPTLKSLDELGESYGNYIGAGMSAEEAYWAVKAKEKATKMQPPKSFGEINKTPAEKTTFTLAEVKAMSPEEQEANYEKIMASMPTWKK